MDNVQFRTNEVAPADRRHWNGTQEEGSRTLPLRWPVRAIVSSDDRRSCVVLSITDPVAGTTYTIRIPSREASDLAVALVNAANGL